VCGRGRQHWPAVAVVSAVPIGNRAGPSPAGESARQQQTACATHPGVAHGEDTAVVTGHYPTCVAYGEDTAVVTGHSPTCVAYGEDTAVVTGHSPTCVAYGEDTAVVTGHYLTCVAYGENTAPLCQHGVRQRGVDSLQWARCVGSFGMTGADNAAERCRVRGNGCMIGACVAQALQRPLSWHC